MSEKDKNSLTVSKVTLSGKSVICFQESHNTQKIENLWRYQWHCDMIFSHGTQTVEESA